MGWSSISDVGTTARGTRDLEFADAVLRLLVAAASLRRLNRGVTKRGSIDSIRLTALNGAGPLARQDRGVALNGRSRHLEASDREQRQVGAAHGGAAGRNREPIQPAEREAERGHTRRGQSNSRLKELAAQRGDPRPEALQSDAALELLRGIRDGISNETKVMQEKMTQLVQGVENQSRLLNEKLSELAQRIK
jgi:hypothetical protein